MNSFFRAFLSIAAMGCIAAAQMVERQVNIQEKGWSIRLGLPTTPRLSPDGRGWNFIDLTEMSLTEKQTLVLFSGTYFFKGHFWESDPGRLQVTMVLHRPGPVGIQDAQTWWYSKMEQFPRKPTLTSPPPFLTRIIRGKVWAEVKGFEQSEYGSRWGNFWRVFLLPLDGEGCIEIKTIVYADTQVFLESKWKKRVQESIDLILDSLEVVPGPRKDNPVVGPSQIAK